MISLTNVSTHSPHISLTEDITTVSQSTPSLTKPRPHKKNIRQESDRVPFVEVTFNQALPNINHIITGNRNILHSSQRCKEAIPSPPLISRFRSFNNLRDIPQVTQALCLGRVRDMFHNMSRYREHVGRSFSLEIC